MAPRPPALKAMDGELDVSHLPVRSNQKQRCHPLDYGSQSLQLY